MSGNSRDALARSETAAVRSILVATDFSSAADLAVQRAFDLARLRSDGADVVSCRYDRWSTASDAPAQLRLPCEPLSLPLGAVQ